MEEGALEYDVCFPIPTLSAKLLPRYPVTQHLSAIFILIASFVRLLDDLCNPQFHVWLSIISFLVRYFAQELLECFQPGHVCLLIVVSQTLFPCRAISQTFSI